jgi:rhomboid protease GluP
MICSKITSILENKEFDNIQVNIEELSLLYKVVSDKAYVVGIFGLSSGKILTYDQYVNIVRQISENFKNRYSDGVDILCILCTNDLENTKKTFGNDDRAWIVDEKKKRLIIYENQPKDYMNLRRDIEETLVKISIDYENGTTDSQRESIDSRRESMGINIGGYQEYEAYRTSAQKEKGIKDFIFTISFLIIVINILIYIFINMGVLVDRPRVVLEEGALYWPNIFYNHEYYRIFTYMFLHYDISHIGNNMLLLLILGEVLEKVVGKVRFSAIYFITGIVAGISSASYNMIYKYNVISVGASGAIFGVIGAMAYIVLVNKGRVDNISKSRMMLFVGMSLYSGLTSQSVDNIAHVSGLIAGVILAAILYRKDKKRLGRD